MVRAATPRASPPHARYTQHFARTEALAAERRFQRVHHFLAVGRKSAKLRSGGAVSREAEDERKEPVQAELDQAAVRLVVTILC